MYIKRVRKRNPGGEKDYEYLHLVENVRTEHGPRQRLLLNLGVLPLVPEDHKALANTIEGMLLGQANLLSPDLSIERYARNALQKLLARDAQSEAKKKAHAAQYQLVDVASMQASTVRSLGAEYVGHRLWQALGFTHALVEAGCSRQWLPLCEALVVGRLVAPGSERYSWAWMQTRSAIFEFTGRPIRASLNALYRATDVLFSYKEALEKHLSQRMFLLLAWGRGENPLFTFQLHKFLRLAAKNGVKTGGSSSFSLSSGFHRG